MIDLHSDTIYGLWSGKDKSLIKNSLSIDKEKLEKGGVRGQCLALFTPVHECVSPEHKE